MKRPMSNVLTLPVDNVDEDYLMGHLITFKEYFDEEGSKLDRFADKW